MAPENTLAAARKALSLGADLWELDLVMTSDGHPLVHHDLTLGRTSNAAQVFPARRPWRVHEFSLEDIRSLDFGSWFTAADPFGQIAAGNVSSEEMAGFSGEAAPTLEAALEFTRTNNWLVNLELKDLSGQPGHQSFVRRVVEIVEAWDMVERVLISSFHHPYLYGVKALNPQILTGLLASKWLPGTHDLFRAIRADTYHPHVSIAGPRLLRPFVREGIPVLVWVVNDKPAMRSLIDRGMNGIFTDFPQRLKGLLSDV